MLFTHSRPKIHARDDGLNEAMKRKSLECAGSGFNASHSLGAILFGLVFIILALENYVYLKSSVALNTLLVAGPLIFAALAFKYWFSVPRNWIIAGTLLIGCIAGVAPCGLTRFPET